MILFIRPTIAFLIYFIVGLATLVVGVQAFRKQTTSKSRFQIAGFTLIAELVLFVSAFARAQSYQMYNLASEELINQFERSNANILFWSANVIFVAFTIILVKRGLSG